jgi:hypothetical protein
VWLPDFAYFSSLVLFHSLHPALRGISSKGTVVMLRSENHLLSPPADPSVAGSVGGVEPVPPVLRYCLGHFSPKPRSSLSLSPSYSSRGYNPGLIARCSRGYACLIQQSRPVGVVIAPCYYDAQGRRKWACPQRVAQVCALLRLQYDGRCQHTRAPGRLRVGPWKGWLLPLSRP